MRELPIENAKAWDIAIFADRREGEEDDLSGVPERVEGLEEVSPGTRVRW